jgi:hypothetical protein
VLALAGAGIALVAAVALVTFIKVLGIGLLGGGNHEAGRASPATIGACRRGPASSAAIRASQLLSWLDRAIVGGHPRLDPAVDHE